MRVYYIYHSYSRKDVAYNKHNTQVIQYYNCTPKHFFIYAQCNLAGRKILINFLLQKIMFIALWRHISQKYSILQHEFHFLKYFWINYFYAMPSLAPVVKYLFFQDCINSYSFCKQNITKQPGCSPRSTIIHHLVPMCCIIQYLLHTKQIWWYTRCLCIP